MSRLPKPTATMKPPESLQNVQTNNAAARYPRDILAACCIPWLSGGVLAEGIFRDGIRLLLRQGLNHLYIFGTAGEGYAVTESQFDRITKVFCEEMQEHGAEPMVGIISLSMGTMFERIERAREMGVRDFQISLPCWGALDDAELFLFFDDICGNFRDCRFLHYNLLRTKRLLQPAEYAVLAEKHPNLVATKQSSRDVLFIGSLLRKAPQIRHFFTEPGFAYASQWGEVGLLLSIGSTNLNRAREYFDAGVRMEADKLIRLQRELMDLLDGLTAVVGTSAHMDGAYDKIFSRLHDERFPLELLTPYRGVTQSAFEAYREFLEQSFPQWLSNSDVWSS